MRRQALLPPVLLGLLVVLTGASCEITPDQERALCEAGRGVVCDRLDVLLVDLCAQTVEVIERCDRRCKWGQCVDLADSEGVPANEGEGEVVEAPSESVEEGENAS